MKRRTFLRKSALAGSVLALGSVRTRGASQNIAASSMDHGAPKISTVVSSGAARLGAESAGAGQPLVFLHANVADRRMWLHQLASLASKYQVIAFDRRGFGETPSVGGSYSQTADLFAVLDRIAGSGKRAILVGCSHGGSIAVDAALEAPDRVAAMVLISSSVSGAPTGTPSNTAGRLVDTLSSAVKSGDVDLAIRLRAALFLDGPLANEGRVQGPARELFFEMNRIALAASAAGEPLQSQPAWDRLSQIAVPVRVLCGDLDFPHIQARGKELAATCPEGRFEAVTGAAHLPSLEQPERITSRLSELLAEL
jgi:pimeloyl-ACP methyl ester carboxylesterase